MTTAQFIRRFLNRRGAESQRIFLRKRIILSSIFLCALAPLWFNASSAAQDVNILAAPQLPPYQWFASTDPKHKNADYIELKPGETKRIPLAAGELLRLWSTGFEPDKLTLSLDNGWKWPLLKDGKAQHGTFFKKAYTFYPSGSIPTPLKTLKSGAALVATNTSKAPNKWFYQVSVGRALEVFKVAPSSDLIEREPFIASGAQVDLLAAQNGGRIDRLSILTDGADALSHLHLQAQWDKDGELALDILLSMLAAQIQGMKEARTAFVNWNGTTLEINWPMPYGKGARLWLKNDADISIRVRYQLQYTKKR